MVVSPKSAANRYAAGRFGHRFGGQMLLGLEIAVISSDCCRIELGVCKGTFTLRHCVGYRDATDRFCSERRLKESVMVGEQDANVD